jgi:hypothetical protein
MHLQAPGKLGSEISHVKVVATIQQPVLSATASGDNSLAVQACSGAVFANSPLLPRTVSATGCVECNSAASRGTTMLAQG